MDNTRISIVEPQNNTILECVQGEESKNDRSEPMDIVMSKADHVEVSCSPARSTGVEIARRSARKARLFMLAIVLLIVVLVFISLALGRYPIEPADAFNMLLAQWFPIEETWSNQAEILYFNVRLPRIMMALLVGCCLSAAGASFQGTFQNPLASPDILGASQGAALGAAIAILLGAGSFAISMTAFAFSMITIVLVFIISSVARGNRIMVTILAGVMVSSLFSAGVSFCKLVADPTDQLPAITYWLMGSLTAVRLEDVVHVLPAMVIGCAVLIILRWRINILTMGDDEAATMGVNARRIRIIVTFMATLITATCVSVTGIIGWVGLVIPHLARMVVGCDYRRLMPTSMLMGAAFLLVVDDVSRLATTAEIPIGILTAFIGAPFFLYLILRRKKI